MKTSRWLALLALAALYSLGGPLRAGDLYSDKEPPKLDPSVLPKSAEIKALTVNPTAIKLKGGDDAQQLILSATLISGKLQDLSSVATYAVADGKVARVTSAGRVLPLANGTTEVAVTF